MSGKKDSRDETREGSRRERIRRDDAERQQPNRGWQGWFQNDSRPDTGGGNNPRGGEGRGGVKGKQGKKTGSGSPMDTVERGVKMAYEVVEDYIDQGRKTAQRINKQQYGPREMTEDFQALTERMMRDSTRFLSLWFELMGSTLGAGLGLARGGFPGSGDRRSREPSKERSGGDSRETVSASADVGDPDVAPEPPAARAPIQAQVALEVRSTAPTRVEVDLPRDAAEQPLHVTPLQPLAGNAPPLEGVGFEPGSARANAVVSLEVPAEQAPGAYHGTLVDPETHRGRGSVTVVVSEPPKAKKKAPAKTAPAKKTATRKTATRKSPTKKGSTKKAPTRKSTSKKSTSKGAR